MADSTLALTLRLLVDGQQQLLDVQKTLDSLQDKTLNVRVNNTGAGSIDETSQKVSGLGETIATTTNEADKAATAVDSTTEKYTAMGTTAENMGQRVEAAGTQVTTMGSTSVDTASKVDNMGASFERTRGHLNNLTGGMAGFIPMLAGMSLVGTIQQFGEFGHQVELTKDLMGGTAQQASDWTGAATDMGISSRMVAMTVKGLQMNLDALNVTQAKNIDTTQVLAIEANKVRLAQDAYNAAVKKYGENSDQALTKQDALTVAQEHYNSLVSSGGQALNKFTAGAKDLGIQIYDNNGKMLDTNTILMEMANAYANTNDQQRATQDITGMLGQRAYQILPLLQQGASGIQELFQQTRNSGMEMNQQTLDTATTAEKNFQEIQQRIKGFMMDVASDVTPVIEFVSDHIGAFEKLAETIAGIVAIKAGWAFGKDLVKDLREAVDLAKGLGGKVAHIAQFLGGRTGSGAAPPSDSGGVGGALDMTKGIRVFGGPVEVIGKGGLPGLRESAPQPPVTEPLAAGGGGAAAAETFSGAMAPATAALVVAAPAAMVANQLFMQANILKGMHDTLMQDEEAIKKSVGPTNLTAQQWQKIFEDLQDHRIKTRGDLLNEVRNLEGTNTATKTTKETWGNILGDAQAFENFGKGWAPTVQSDLKKVLIHGSDYEAAMGDLSTLIAQGKVTNSEQVASYLKNWNSIQQHATDAQDAQQKYAMLLEQGQIPLGSNINDFITAWNQSKENGDSVQTEMKIMSDLSSQAAQHTTDTAQWLGSLANQIGVPVNTIISDYVTTASFAASSAQHAQDINNLLATGVTDANGVDAKVGSMRAGKWGGIFGFEWGGMLPHYASGGPIVVGEAGPEIFQPPGVGEIIPNHRLQTLGGGAGGGAYNHFDLRGSTFLSDRDIDALIRKMEDRLTTVTLPSAGRQLTR